jgi:hypothetical protein
LQIELRVVSATPTTTMTDRLKERIKMVMVSRFNKDGKSLDLSRLHVDPGNLQIFHEIKEEDYLFGSKFQIGGSIGGLKLL